ncbi:hypothetical protein ACGFW5_30935 [Streptomyces sp. NPDC048416]|uniref:hypothetical protein n=1 Tax=Streptomyces sp. NPDC048416 TaxID=3365546 RepID=UPI00371AA3C1
MNTRALNALAGVIAAALKQDRTPMGIALAVESAGMLQSPETASRLMRAEQRRAELEAVLTTHRKDDRAEIEKLRARVAELEAVAARPPLPRRPVSPLAHGRAASEPTQTLRDLLGHQPVEDPHDSPLHHTYTTARLRDDEQGATDGR